MTDQPTLDWRTCPAGRALDRLVAERAGWYFQEIGDGTGILIRPDGHAIYPALPDIPEWHPEYAHPWTEEYVWEHGLPAFSTSVDAALTLLDAMPLPDWSLFQRPTLIKRFGCKIQDFDNTEIYPIEECDNTPALAICRAFLAWQEQQQRSE